ncbi:MAG: S1/P1 nuclease [Candidatus Acidiferrales bacterium]
MCERTFGPTLKKNPSCRLLIPILILISIDFACAPSARAWGCQGHQTIAYIAEAHLTPRARTMALKILAASPIDPSLSRWCRPRASDPFADASTWADDVRSQRPNTAQWHFIDIPRGAHRGNLAPYCPPATGCVVSALESQIRVLKNPRASPKDRADALRFVIHFVGDMHQPLHDVTNNDLGGNCVPVEFFGQQPRETNDEREYFSPNLHAIWDDGIIDRFDRGESSRQLARDLDRKFRAQIAVWEKQPTNFAAWVWEAHALADSVAYGKLPHAIPIESPKPVSSCADDHHVGERMLGYHEDLGAAYEAAAAPVVQRQLARAGARLADVLNSLWR